jgi:hypothetical protein
MLDQVEILDISFCLYIFLKKIHYIEIKFFIGEYLFCPIFF